GKGYEELFPDPFTVLRMLVQRVGMVGDQQGNVRVFLEVALGCPHPDLEGLLRRQLLRVDREPGLRVESGVLVELDPAVVVQAGCRDNLLPPWVMLQGVVVPLFEQKRPERRLVVMANSDRLFPCLRYDHPSVPLLLFSPLISDSPLNSTSLPALSTSSRM